MPRKRINEMGTWKQIAYKRSPIVNDKSVYKINSCFRV